MRASLGHADNAARVFLRPRPHFVAVVPPESAHANAVILRAKEVAPPTRPGEAFRMRLLAPQNVMPALPATIKKVNM